MKNFVKCLLLCALAAPMLFTGCKTETKAYLYSLTNSTNDLSALVYFEGKVDFDDYYQVSCDPAELEKADAEAVNWFNGIISAIDDTEATSKLSGVGSYYTLKLMRTDSEGSTEITHKTWQKEAE